MRDALESFDSALEVHVDGDRSLAFLVMKEGTSPDLAALKKAMSPYRAESLEKIR